MMKNINKKMNSKKAFTLVEVIISMGIFVIIMAGSSGVFISAFKSYKGAKNVNENLKNAQYAMNLMTKTFRTSSVVSSNSNFVVVYDYSRTSRSCIRYRFLAGNLYESKVNTPNLASCRSILSTSFNNVEVVMTSGTVTGSFSAIDSAGDVSGPSSTRVGRVTATMKVTNSSGGTSSSAQIQSTVSLRDYTVSLVGVDLNNDPN